MVDSLQVHPVDQPRSMGKWNQLELYSKNSEDLKGPMALWPGPLAWRWLVWTCLSNDDPKGLIQHVLPFMSTKRIKKVTKNGWSNGRSSNLWNPWNRHLPLDCEDDPVQVGALEDFYYHDWEGHRFVFWHPQRPQPNCFELEGDLDDLVHVDWLIVFVCCLSDKHRLIGLLLTDSWLTFLINFL